MGRNTIKVDLQSGAPWKRIVQFAAPMLLGNVFQEMYNAVDTLVVGRFVGANALAAVGAAGVPFNLINAVTIGFSVGATILIGQYYGAKGSKELKRISGTILIMSALLGLVVTGMNAILCRPLLKLLNVTDSLIDSSTKYLQTIGVFLIPMILYNNASGMLRGIGNSRVPLFALIICTILNTALDLLFVLVFHWGVFGVAIATGIAQLVSAILVLTYIWYKVPELRPTKEEFQIDGVILRKTTRLGLPNAIQHGAVMLGIVVLQRIINSYGDLVIAAYSVGAKINSFAQLPMMSMSSAISTFVAQNLAAKEEERVKSGVRFGLLCTIGLTALISIGIMVFRYPLIGLFTKESDLEVIRIGGQYIMIIGSLFVVMAAINVFQGTLTGAGDTVFTMVASMAMTFLRIPLAYLFTGMMRMDYRGAWLTFPVSWVIWLGIILVRYRSNRWKKVVVEK